MKLNYKFRFYPTLKQEAQLEEWLRIGAYIWNCALREYENENALVYGSRSIGPCKRDKALGEFGDKKIGFTYNDARLVKWKKNVQTNKKECEKRSVIKSPRTSRAFQISQMQMVEKEYPGFFDSLPAQTRNEIVINLEKAREQFFKGVRGYPKYKNWRDFKSLVIPSLWKGSKQIRGVIEYKKNSDKWAYLDKVSKNLGKLKIRIHRKIPGKYTQIIIKRESEKAWYVYLCVDVPQNILPKTYQEAGVDVGCTYLASWSNGSINPPKEWNIKNPRTIASTEKHIKSMRRRAAFSKTKNEVKIMKGGQTRQLKKKGSRRWKKAQDKIRVEMARAKRITDDFAAKSAHKLIKENDVLYIEGNKEGKRMDIANLKKGAYSKALHSAPIGKFCSALEYKAKLHGRKVEVVNKDYTSQICPKCDFRNKIPIGKSYVCARCEYQGHRDYVAGFNTLREGQSGAITKLASGFASGPAGTPAQGAAKTRNRSGRRKKGAGQGPPSASCRTARKQG